ncbi:MAG: UbiA prenyltransferase family protein [Myxococcales bacterium]|nr:UbiA prenyltransferase family protein [Myxococcales bacterium]
MAAATWARAMRLHQWVKNAFVLAPLVFAGHLTMARDAAAAAVAALAFCLASSAVYILNDTLDVAADRLHPSKRLRPIASGALPLASARRGAALLALAGLALAAIVAPGCALMVGGYLLLGAAYSWRLKHLALVDALVIALGFLLRVLAGGFAAGVAVSPWLLGCTGLLAMLLGLGKRAHELAWSSQVDAARQPTATRAALSGYNLTYLRWSLWGLGAITTGVYALYTRAATTVALFGTTDLVWTIPLPALGMGRFVWLALNDASPASPTETMLKDPWMRACVAVWVASTLAVVYW